MTAVIPGSSTGSVNVASNGQLTISEYGDNWTGGPAYNVFNFDDTTVIINGTVARDTLITTAATVFSDSGADDTSVLVGETGYVFGNYAIYLNGTNNFIQNQGTITGMERGINVTDGIVDNAGTISILNLTVGTTYGIYASLAKTVTNSGAITGADTGVYMGNGGTFTNSGTVYAIKTAISIDGDSSNVLNTGELTGDTTETVQMVGNGNLVENQGVISSFSGAGVFMAGQFSGASNTLINAGTISGLSHGVFLQSGSFGLSNSGTITGTGIGIEVDSDPGESSRIINVGRIETTSNAAFAFAISSEGGAETVINLGTVLGNVQLGAGDDVYRNVLNGVTQGTVDGGAGEDRLFGSRFDDTLLGGDDEDVIRGGDGNDQIEGGADGDVLRGEDGDDVLIGGAGRDVQFGGAGADTFEFQAISDSAGSERDVLRDFEIGVDFLDISALDSNITFIGALSFSGLGSAEVQVKVNGGGNSIVSVDVNGSGSEDLRFSVVDVIGITEADFIL